MISCGEPIALEIANRCNPKLQATIVTDHLLTQSVRLILDNLINCPITVKSFLAELEHYELNQDKNAMAFLSPPEFGMPYYREYLSQNRYWHECLEIGGLFYDPIPPRELECAPHYEELAEINRKCPIVIVFGGGGKVWDDIYCRLHGAIENGDLKQQQKGNNAFSLILRDTQIIDGKCEVIPRSWKLFMPGDKKGRPLDDPGKMMYWYAACTLLVGRGGLAAQQILATMLSDASSAPNMLFIPEPGHPQIESERKMLSSLGLIHTCDDLNNFISKPFAEIAKVLEKKDSFSRIREQARLRYVPGIMDRLTDFILGKYEPHK